MGLGDPHRGAALPRRPLVVLEPSPATVVDLESVVSGLGTDQLSINTEAEVLTSRRLMIRVTEQLGLTADRVQPWLGAETLPAAEVSATARCAPLPVRSP
ncbi:MAG: hypothetical protein R3D59_01175 [Paracoccaceae bacterium]